MPKGIVLESLRDKDRIGDYTRMYTMFGFGAVSEIVEAADGGTIPAGTNVSRAGVWTLIVA
jgi:hypothetical protein